MNTLLESFLASRRRLARLVGRIVRPDEIEDIVQETFVLSYAASRSQNIRNPQAFMMRVAHNIALKHVGRAERRLSCSLEDVHEIDIVSEMDTELHCQSQERFLEFCRAVSALPVVCRRVFILKKIYGLSLEEISDHLGISTSTVEKHVAKGLAAVTDHMLKADHLGASSKHRVSKRNRGE